jgi:oligogalacturonide transporter
LGFSIFASIICVAVPGIIVSLFEDARVGYQIMSLCFGLIFGLSVLVTGLFAREEITTPPVQAALSIREMAKPLKLRPFRQYLGMFLVLQMSMAIMSGLFFFYIDFYVIKDITFRGEDSMVGLIAAALMFSMQIVALPIYLKMISKKGKTFAYRFGAYLWIAMALLLLVIPPNVNPVYIFGLAALMGFGISGPGLVPHTMYGDVVDAGQVMFKDRLDGQMSGFTNFINKLAQALGLALAMFVIGLADFQSQDLTLPKITEQPDSAMLAIRIIMALVPLIFMGIGIAISFRYKIDDRKQKEIADAIRNQTSNQDDLIAGL